MPNFTQLTNSLNIIQALSDLPNDTDNLTSAQLKAKFDEAVNIIKTFLNSTLISELEASGASAKLGALVGGVAGNIQTFINNVEAAGTGNLPPSGSVTNVMMANDVKIGSLASLTTTNKASVQGAINELVTSINNKQTPADVLTTEGDLMYRNATTPTRLPKGNANQLLKMNAGATAPEWLALGTAYQGLGVNNAGTALQWIETLQSILTTAGDIIYASTSNTPTRLAKGTAGQVLQMNTGATAPEWATPEWVKIETKTLASNTNKVDFTNIPYSTFNTFKVKFRGSGNGSAGAVPNIAIRIDDDASLSAYNYTYSYQNSNTSITGAATNGNSGILAALYGNSTFINSTFGEIIMNWYINSLYYWINANSIITQEGRVYRGGFSWSKIGSNPTKISILNTDANAYYFAGSKFELWGSNY
jgi:hypothetical protein